MSDAIVIYGFFLEPKTDSPWDYPNVDHWKWWREKTEGLPYEIATRHIPFLEGHQLHSMVFVGILDSLRDLGGKLDPEPLHFPDDETRARWDETLLEFAKRARFKVQIFNHSEKDSAEPYTIRWWATASPL